jgi:hypothetical protein
MAIPPPDASLFEDLEHEFPDVDPPPASTEYPPPLTDEYLSNLPPPPPPPPPTRSASLPQPKQPLQVSQPSAPANALAQQPQHLPKQQTNQQQLPEQRLSATEELDSSFGWDTEQPAEDEYNADNDISEA